MGNITIKDILSLTSDLKDMEESQERFRNFIKRKSSLEDLKRWIKECLEETGNSYNRAFQDLVNLIGMKLGFDVRFGLYQGRKNEIGCDGVWKFPNDNIEIVVEVKKSTAFNIDPNQIIAYIDELKQQSPQKSYHGIFVIGEEKIDTIINTIRGSNYRQNIRVVPIQSLITLLELKYNASIKDDKLMKLIVPLDTINLGEIIDLINDIVETRIREEKIQNPDEKETPSIKTESILTINKNELRKLEEGRVAVCPSKPDGLNFLIKYNSWGFINIAGKPKYFALYVSAPESSIQYFGEVEAIMDPRDPSSPLAENIDKYSNQIEGKQLIKLKENSLRRLKEEILLGENRNKAIQSLRYWNLSELIAAESIDDL